MKTLMNITNLAAALAMLAALFPEAAAHAQCASLGSGTCETHSGVPVDFSVNQTVGYWMLVGVSPEEPDDKDIYMYSACPASGSLLASSVLINGTDFVVGDFNHNAYGAYYPRVQYGSNTDSYEVLWLEGGEMLPISAFRSDWIGGTGGSCDHYDIYDVQLLAGAEYEFYFSQPMFDAHMALFRNPGTGTYWAGRGSSEFELTGHFVTHPYILDTSRETQ
jgi:hypothetical protein